MVWPLAVLLLGSHLACGVIAGQYPYHLGEQQQHFYNPQPAGYQTSWRASGSGYGRAVKNYPCRQSVLQYDCIFNDVHIGKTDTTGFSFGSSDVSQNEQQNITFSNSALRKLPAALVNSFPDVRLLNLENLFIEQIEPNAFANGRFLRELYLSFNAISDLPDGVFGGLQSLERLTMDRNNITRLSLHTFDMTAKLTAFSMTNNNLEWIEDDTFRITRNLENLNVSSNRLIHCDLSFIPSLFDVDVSHNQLETIAVPPGVEELFASNNRIRTVVGGQADGALKVLDLNHNNLTDIGWLGKFPHLTQLDLSYNELEKVSHTEFARQRHLMTLSLKNNRLVVFDFVMANGERPLQALKVLDLSHNNLMYVEKNQVQFQALNELYLDHNAIVRLKLASTNNIRTLTLSSNDWDCANLRDDLFRSISRTVIRDDDHSCRSEYQLLEQQLCCKEHDMPYLDRLMQKIKEISIAEKQSRAQGKCSAETAISGVKALSELEIQNTANQRSLQQHATDIQQLQTNVTQGRLEQARLVKSVTEVHGEIDSVARLYRIFKEGFMTPPDHLRKVHKHLQQRRAFKERESAAHRQEVEKKRQEMNELLHEKEVQEQKLDNAKATVIEKQKEIGAATTRVKKLEARKHNNPKASRITT